MLLSVAERANDAAAAWSLRARLDATDIPVTDIDRGAQTAMEYPQSCVLGSGVRLFSSCRRARSHARSFTHAPPPSLPLSLIYFTPLGSQADRAALPLDVAYPSKKIAFLRSSFTDANATFASFKACNCSWNHGDLDAGSFVYSARGQRWVVDLGAESYSVPDYFGALRFEYYRKNSRGHNVLSFGNALHDAEHCFSGQAHATTTFLGGFNSTSGEVHPAPPGHALGGCELAPGEGACATMDLTAAFALQGVAAASRRFALSANRTTLTVSDSWALRAGAAHAPNATAALHTLATVTLASERRSAELEQGGARLRVRVAPTCACAASALFSATPVRLAPPQDPSFGLTRVDITVDPACGALDVILEPA